MDLILCWLVAPIGFVAVTVGLSLLAERATGFAVPWTVRPALGMALAIVLAQLGTATAFTATLTLAAIVILGIAGLIVGRRDFAAPPGGVEVGLAAGVFALFAMPFLVSGEASWAGYIKLDDNATWALITDHVFEHGRALIEQPPSTHQQVLEDYLGGTYPIGGFVPMALMSWISGQDVAFTLQPSMAVAAAMLALLLFQLARGFLRGVGAAAFVAGVSVFSALLLGYYLWGGVKELVVAALLPLGPILAGIADREGWPARAWASISLTIAAILVVLGPGGALWAIPPLLPALYLVLSRDGAARAARLLLPVGGLTVLLFLPVLFTPTGPFNPVNGGITGEDEIGNLFGPLSLLQGAGIWPSIDFRTGPELSLAIKVLAAVAILAAAAAVVFAARRPRGAGMPLVGYVGGGALGAAVAIAFGSTWVDAKVLATLSPAVLAAALLGIVALGQRTSLRLESRILAGIFAAAVAWGAVLAYQGAWIAPRSHYDELEAVNARFAGEGPALITEVSGYGPRHFLTDLEAEGASDRRRRPVFLRSGEMPADAAPVDLDEIQSGQLDPYNLLIVRRAPATSRAPGEFSLVHSGDHYDVWRRGSPPGALVEHLSLGTQLDAGSVPDCAEVARLANLAGSEGTLVAARVGRPIAIDFEAAEAPPGWTYPTPYTFSPDGSGRASAPIEVPGGRYEIWLGGEVLGAATVYIDGEEVAFQRGVLNNTAGMEYLATVELAPGEHRLELDYESGGLFPGSASRPYEVGPLELREPQAGDLGVVRVAPSGFRRLCGKRWDWIEAREP